MTSPKKLKAAKDLADLAKLLGFTPSGLSFVLYRTPNSEKYRVFEIPKKSGEKRVIKAPIEQLALMQSRLSELLYDCVREIKRENQRFWMPSHGFQKERTIVSNAAAHKRKRFVFNADIEDFFGSINFGRVRGFFIKDKIFALEESVATVIAQIACHDNSLPQGSPCSPVISNLIGNILDMKLVALARDNKCTYTRYADDLTFSTNETLFPEEIAKNQAGDHWLPGKRLDAEITKSGFALNPQKTRMALSRSRQTVTGLVVNQKPNIDRDYYRAVRSMCNELFQRGQYHRAAGGSEELEYLNNLNPLEGMLSYIYFVKARRDRPFKVNKDARDSEEFAPPKAPIDLYRKFLFFKHFVAPTAPVIVPEGVTDITYLRCAIKALEKKHPTLVAENDGEISVALNFLNPSGNTRDVLNLGHGAAGQASLVLQYSKRLKKYAFRPLGHPVIILCDNDSGPKTVFKNAKAKGVSASTSTTDPFYYLGDNLYLIKVPEGGVPTRDMEDLFPDKWLKLTYEGKTFDKKKEHGDDKTFGKVDFAEKIVKANAKKIDFSEFDDLLTRIEACLAHFKTLSLSKGSAAKSA